MLDLNRGPLIKLKETPPSQLSSLGYYPIEIVDCLFRNLIYDIFNIIKLIIDFFTFYFMNLYVLLVCSI